MLTFPSSVTVVDVSARDGLQSFHRWVDTDVKVAMVDRLSTAGFPVIEVTNFAHPRVIPHLQRCRGGDGADHPQARGSSIVRRRRIREERRAPWRRRPRRFSA